MVAGAGARFLTILSTFLLTRYLAPDVQGEVNLAAVLVGTAGAATALGVGQYVAAHPKEGRETAFHGSLLVLGAGVLSCLGCVAAGPFVARGLKVPGMAHYVPGLAAAHYLDRCGWVPRAILVREMRFRTAGLRVALGELAFAVSSVALASRGWRGNAIVGGSLVRSVVGLGFMLSVSQWRDYLLPCRLALGTFKRILWFGLPITIGSFFRLAAMSWDNSFMGFRFGEATVGVYNQAYRLAELPAGVVGDQLNDVLVPTFARVDGPEARRRGFMRAASLMALLIFPMAFGLAAIAPTLVSVFYPPAYAGVAPFLMVLALLGLARSFGALAGAFLQVVGRTRSFMVTDLLLLVSVLGLMSAFARWGPVPAAAGVIVAFLMNLGLVLRVLRLHGITLAAVFLAVVGPLSACAPMVGAVLGVRHGMASLGLPGAVRLAAELVAGAVTYAGASLLLAPRVCRDSLALAKAALRRRGGSRAGE
jgi:lipopolysaccharide exporter